MSRTLKGLTEAQYARYQEDGGLAPVAAIGRARAAEYRECLEAFERRSGGSIMQHPGRPTIWSKPHLLFTWVDAIVRHPRVLDVVEDVIGPDIRVFHTNVFVKEPRSQEFIPWHQDGAYNAIRPAEVFTTWVALSAATPEMGCMKLLRGSHRHGLRVHVDRPGPGNLLSRGQRIESLEDAETVDLALAPGEMSIHHSFAVHASEPNRSDERRIGVMTTYVPPHCRYVGTGPERFRCAQVRGQDRFGHFDDEPAPQVDFGERERAEHRESCTRYIANVTASNNRQLDEAVVVRG